MASTLRDVNDKSGLPSFSIALERGGAPGGYRIQNPPNAPYQRRDYFYRPGYVEMQGECVEVVHGRLDPESQTYATLIVLDLRFNPTQLTRRISRATVSFEFQSDGNDDIEVAQIAPEGGISVLPSMTDEELINYLKITLGTPQNFPNLTTQLGHQRVLHRQIKGAMKVVGLRCFAPGRDYEPKTCAKWTLLEDEQTESGIPAYMRAVILLKRKTEQRFKCFIKVKAKMDFTSTLENLFTRTPKDDPVFFDPKLAPHKGGSYNPDYLGCLKLTELGDITAETIFQKGQKAM